MNHFKQGVEKICLYHLPGIPPINEDCKTKCSEDYNLKHRVNNFGCPDFFPFPQVSYREVIKELERRNIKITSKVEKFLRREVAITDTVLASKRIKVSPKKFVYDFIQHLSINKKLFK